MFLDGFTAGATHTGVTETAEGYHSFTSAACRLPAVSSIMLTSDGVGIGGTSIASDMIDTGTGIVGVAMRSRDSSAMHNSAARSRNAETVLQRGAQFTHGVPDAKGVFTENTASNWFDAGVVTMDASTVADYAAKHAGEGFLTEAQCGNFETDGKLSTLGYADVVGAGTLGGTAEVTGGIAGLECMNGKLHSGANLERRLIDVSVASYALPFRHPSSRRPSWPTSPMSTIVVENPPHDKASSFMPDLSA